MCKQKPPNGWLLLFEKLITKTIILFVIKRILSYSMKRFLPSIACLIVMTCSCNDSPTTAAQYNHNDSLLAYKNSPHHIIVGYLVGDGYDSAAAYNPANVPDSVDYIEFFAGRDTVQSHWLVAQAKGIKIIASHFVSDVYFDGSAKDPATKVLGYVRSKGLDMHHPTATSTYNHWARDMYERHMVIEKLDGIDLDIEKDVFGTDVAYAAANADSLMVALGKYFGPNCTECNTIKKPVFFYDTDGSSGVDSTMYLNHKDNYDYVLFQSYTTGRHNWKGSDTTNFAPLVAMYGAGKLVFMVNGDSFLYPNGKQDNPDGDSIATVSLYSYANYVKNNNCAGVGVYRMSRDYNHKPHFAVSRHAIQIMNPAK